MAKLTVAVIGLGRFGYAMATTLASLGHDVIGIDGDEDKVRAVADTVSLAMQLDATDEKALRGAGIRTSTSRWCRLARTSSPACWW